jgi:two-component system response regulator AtoC
LAATNRDIEDRVRQGLFREDLYFRLNVIRLRLPPLRERPLDIIPLAGLFLERFGKRSGKGALAFSPEALRLLSGYTYPGNIRELENIVERAVILCDGELIRGEDCMLDARGLSQGPIVAQLSPGEGKADIAPESGALSMREAEKQAVIAALARNGGHRERTSAELGISRRTLLTKMKDFGLL